MGSFGAAVNEAQGFVQRLKAANLQAQLTCFQTQVANYVNATKRNATVGEVLGTKAIVQDSPALLAGSLPYATKLSKSIDVRTETVTLADGLKWKLRTGLASSSYRLIVDGTGDMIEYQQRTVKLAGRKITLSFVPATRADADLIASYLPQPQSNGTPIRPERLPTSLPGYLLNSKPELRVDGRAGRERSTITASRGAGCWCAILCCRVGSSAQIGCSRSSPTGSPATRTSI